MTCWLICTNVSQKGNTMYLLIFILGVLCGCILGFAVLRSQIKAKMKILFDEKQLIAQDSDGKEIDCDLLYDKLLH